MPAGPAPSSSGSIRARTSSPSSASTRCAAAPGREETARAIRWSSNSRPTPSSAAQPPGSAPLRTAARYAGSRSGSPSACTLSEPGSSPRPAIVSGGPLERVIPPSNQHIAPALSPASTIPRSHASVSRTSSPCARQIASRLRIEPPPM